VDVPKKVLILSVSRGPSDNVRSTIRATASQKLV
jgi:hypothetical protein